MGAAPLAGGALLGVVAGNIKPPDARGAIKADMELLEKIPADQVERRAELQRVIDLRIDELIAGVDRTRQIKELATNYALNREGRLRDVLVFVMTVLFTIIWWNLPNHGRTGWLPMFVVLILLALLSAWYAGRGIMRAVRPSRYRKKDAPQ